MPIKQAVLSIRPVKARNTPLRSRELSAHYGGSLSVRCQFVDVPASGRRRRTGAAALTRNRFRYAPAFDRALAVRYDIHVSTSLITAAEPGCYAHTQPGSACHLMWDWTNNSWLAEGSEFAVRPIRVILIILLCLLARNLINRAITRMTRGDGGKNKKPSKLVPQVLVDPGGVMGERRRQRLRALGSVLRSLVSGVIFTIMLMLVLAEFNVSLGPLLASAGIVGLAIGFGAQALVKDVISGMFMLLEDQYGVGDVVDLGTVTGTVESVGLRVTTIRDVKGTVWYVRNGEILRVGNLSQGWAMVVVDVPVASENAEAASRAITTALERLTEDDKWSRVLLGAPELLGVENLTETTTTLRVSVKTDSEAQWSLAREVRGRIGEALRSTGVDSEEPEVRVSTGTGDNTPVKLAAPKMS